jgi:transcriptional regulator with XRE-family HTH domain
MNKKTLLKGVSSRLKKIRLELGVSHEKMGSYFGVSRTSYTKNENGETFPNLCSFYTLGNNFGVSLDWLICSKGPRYYKSKEAQRIRVSMGVEPEEMKALFEHMERIPLLRHEMLTHFYRFKEENKGLVDSIMNTKEEND